MVVNNEDLENVLNAPRVGEDNPERNTDSRTVPKKMPENTNKTNVSKEEEIGFHKGALNTLVNERNELVKMVQNVEAVMQAHISRLAQLGVKVPVQEKK